MALKKCRCRTTGLFKCGGNAGKTYNTDGFSSLVHYIHVSPSQEVSKTINITKKTCSHFEVEN